MKYQKLISTKIKELRLKNNLTQEEFTEKIGLSLNGVSNIERCRYQPTAETIDKICDAFKISPLEFVTGVVIPVSAKRSIASSFVAIVT